MASKMTTAKGLARLLGRVVGVSTSTGAAGCLPLYILDPLLLLEPERLRSRESEAAVGGSKGFVGVRVCITLFCATYATHCNTHIMRPH